MMDELIRHIQDEVPQCILFANNIVLVNDIREGINSSVERSKEALELKLFRISDTKT